MVGSWEKLIEELGRAEKDSSTIDGAKLNKSIDGSCSCSKTDNLKETNTEKVVINSVEKTPSFFDSLFRAETKKEFIPAKKTYPFFDKQKEVPDKQEETYTKEDVIDPDELIPLFSKQNLVFKKFHNN